MRYVKGKKGQFNFKVLANSVSGIVTVIGAFVIWLSLQYNQPDLRSVGITMVFAGLGAAVLIALGMRLINKM